MTREEIMAARTERGSWTKAQLAEWGVPWPPTSGWIDRLTGAAPKRSSYERCVAAAKLCNEFGGGDATAWSALRDQMVKALES